MIERGLNESEFFFFFCGGRGYWMNFHLVFWTPDFPFSLIFFFFLRNISFFFFFLKNSFRNCSPSQRALVTSSAVYHCKPATTSRSSALHVWSSLVPTPFHHFLLLFPLCFRSVWISDHVLQYISFYFRRTFLILQRFRLGGNESILLLLNFIF